MNAFLIMHRVFTISVYLGLKHTPKYLKKVYTLVWYESYSKIYRLYDPEQRCIILGRNVSFDESNKAISHNDNSPRPFYESNSEDEPQQQDEDDDDNDDNSQTKHHDEEEEHQAPENEENEETQLNAEKLEGAPGAQVPEKKKKTFLRITTTDGRFEKIINAEGKTTMVIPRNKTLRDRGTLKKPERCTAIFASFCGEPGSYQEAMQSKDNDLSQRK
jgi:hypothetical protein